MSAPAVSVVVTCQDRGRSLPEALESVERQTLRDREVLVVDAGSSDPRTRSLLGRLGVQVIHAPCCRPAAARNRGVRASSGHAVALLEADDLLEPTWLERAWAVLERDPGVGFVGCPARRLGAGTELRPAAGFLFEQLLAAPRALPTSTLFRRELFDTLGGFDESLPARSELDFWLRASVAGWSGAAIEAPLLVERALERRAAVVTRHVPAMAAVYEKHRGRIAADPAPALLARERALLSLKERAEGLRARRARVESDLSERRQALAAVIAELEKAGRRRVHWGDARRVRPVSDVWGYDRGTPVDRVFIEAFLERHAADIRGEVLEVGDGEYTRRFGGPRVSRSEVLDIDPGNRAATITADLQAAGALPAARFDCMVLTQVLQLVPDPLAALRECARTLRPGGVLLATLASASRIDRGAGVPDLWRVTEAAAWHWFSSAFAPERVEIRSFGNVLSCSAFLLGLSAEELGADELERHDPYFPLVIAARAVA